MTLRDLFTKLGQLQAVHGPDAEVRILVPDARSYIEYEIIKVSKPDLTVDSFPYIEVQELVYHD